MHADSQHFYPSHQRLVSKGSLKGRTWTLRSKQKPLDLHTWYGAALRRVFPHVGWEGLSQLHPNAQETGAGLRWISAAAAAEAAAPLLESKEGR